MLFTLAMPAMAAQTGTVNTAYDDEDVPTPDEPIEDAPVEEEPAASNALVADAQVDGNTVTLTVKTTQAINNGTVTVTYPDGLSLISATAPVAADGVNTVNTTVAGKITVVWATTGEAAADETVLNATFTGDEGTYTFTTTPGTLYNGTEKVDAEAFDTEATVEHDCPSAVFEDVDPDKWYHSAIDFVVSESLMAGVSEIQFAPNAVLDRATVVTVLYRLAGKPEVTEAADFSDVAAESWYAAAISWASANGIAYGYEDGTFHPTTPVTRQDTAAFLYRYAQKAGYESAELVSLDDYPDKDAVSDYALEAMTWAVSNGIIAGTVVAEGGDVCLAPKDTATRAQYARMIMCLTGLEPEIIVEYTLTFSGEHAAAQIDGEDVTSVTVQAGTQVTFTVSVDDGYELAGVTAGEEALTADEDGNYTVTVNADLTVGLLAVEKVLPPVPETCTITLAGENLEFYQDGTPVTEITVEKGTKYVLFNALGINGYHATTATATNDAQVTNVQNLFVVSNITGDTTVTVDCELNVYTVTFVYPYCNYYLTPDQQVTHGQPATNPGYYPEPCRTGQHLDGWYADEEMTQVFDFETPITGNTTLYSTWTDNIYTVTFHSNGGSEVAPVQVVHGNTIAKPENPTHPEGYAFAGWFSDEELTTAFKFSSTFIREDTDLYAAWFDGELQDVYLDGRNGSDENGGTTAADAVKTFARAKELLPNSRTGAIRVTGIVTIAADTEETWTLSDLSEEAYIIRDISNTSNIALVNGTLNLENITIKGNAEGGKGGYMVQVAKTGTLNVNDGTVITDNVTTSGYSCIYVNGGVFNMNGGVIRNMETTSNSGYGAVYMTSSSTNKSNSTFNMNGGRFENCTATGTGPYSAVVYATSYVSTSATNPYSAISTTNFNGGEIVNCGGAKAKSGVYYDNNVNNVLVLNGTNFENCASVNGMFFLNSNAQIKAGTLTATESSLGRVFYNNNTTSTVKLAPEAEGKLTINGTIFEANTATANKAIVTEGPLSNIGGNLSFEVSLASPGVEIVTGSTTYALTDSDLEAFHLNNDLQGMMTTEIRTNAITLAKTVFADCAVYLDGTNGSDENDGLSAETAVATFAKAKEILQANQVAGGNNWIYITNTVYITDKQTWSLAGIDGAKVVRADSMKSGYMVVISESAAGHTLSGDLTLENIVIDGNKFYNIVANNSMIRVNYGTLTINDGTVLCNAGNTTASASTGAALYICGASKDDIITAATVVMNGGLITGNYAKTSGGAVYLTSVYSEFIMNGGEISGNYAPKGGAIQDNNGGTVRLNGGTIKENTCNEATNPYTADICYGSVKRADTSDALYLNPDFNLPGNALAVQLTHCLALESTIANRAPLTVFVRGTVVDGTVVVKGTESYALTEADLAKLVCANEGYAFALDAENNQIVLRAIPAAEE